MTDDEILKIAREVWFAIVRQPTSPTERDNFRDVAEANQSAMQELISVKEQLAAAQADNARLGRELEYQTDRANANWKALCECRGEEP